MPGTLDIEPYVLVLGEFNHSLDLNGVGGVESICRISTNRAAFRPGIGISRNARTIWIDRWASVVCPPRPTDTDGVRRMEG